MATKFHSGGSPRGSDSRKTRASPAEIGVSIVFVSSEVVTLLVGHHSDADTDGHRRENQYEYTAPQCLHHAGSGRGSLGIAERTTLAEGGRCDGHQDCE